MADSRNFTVVESDINIEGGRYVAKSPIAAAKKAARQLFLKAPASKAAIRFTIRETTIGSGKPHFSYSAHKKRLDEPKTRRINDVEITYTHTYVIKAI